jgi:uncharacterized ferritin-like protein (DUF455 family)
MNHPGKSYYKKLVQKEKLQNISSFNLLIQKYESKGDIL